jgi:hypothetical protein
MLDHLRHPNSGGESPHTVYCREREALDRRNAFTAPVLDEPAILRVVLGNETYLTAGGACFGPVFDAESWREAEANAREWLAYKESRRSVA